MISIAPRPEDIDRFVAIVTGWLHQVPMISTLLILIGLDVLTGLLVAIAKQKLNSSTSWRGLTRKAICVILVGVAAVIEPYAQGLPLAQIVALFYCGAELVSIIENAAALGVPIPRALREVMEKLNDDSQKRVEQKTPAARPAPSQISPPSGSPSTPPRSSAGSTPPAPAKPPRE